MSRFVRNIAGLQNSSGPYAVARFAASIALSLPEVLRRRSLGPADKRMAGRNWRFALQGVELEVPGEYFGLCRELYGRKVYFPRPELDLKPGYNVVDLGANIGLFSVLAALVGCRVVAVEAQHGHLGELEEFAKKHGVRDRIVIEHGLVGAASGVFSDLEKLENSSHAMGKMPPVLAVDEILAKHAVERLDFLKMDIEGSEFDVIVPGAPWLNRVDRIAMEVHPEFGEAAKLVEILRAAGLRVDCRNNYGNSTTELNGIPGHLHAWRA